MVKKKILSYSLVAIPAVITVALAAIHASMLGTAAYKNSPLIMVEIIALMISLLSILYCGVRFIIFLCSRKWVDALIIAALGFVIMILCGFAMRLDQATIIYAT